MAGRPSPTGSFGPDTKRHHPQEMAWVAFVTHEMIETDAPSSISSLTLPLATKGGHRSHAYALDEPAIVSGGRLNAHACVRACRHACSHGSPRLQETAAPAPIVTWARTVLGNGRSGRRRCPYSADTTLGGSPLGRVAHVEVPDRSIAKTARICPHRTFPGLVHSFSRKGVPPISDSLSDDTEFLARSGE